MFRPSRWKTPHPQDCVEHPWPPSSRSPRSTRSSPPSPTHPSLLCGVLNVRPPPFCGSVASCGPYTWSENWSERMTIFHRFELFPPLDFPNFSLDRVAFYSLPCFLLCGRPVWLPHDAATNHRKPHIQGYFFWEENKHSTGVSVSDPLD